MFAISGDIVPLYATVKRWAAHFKMGKESPEDDDNCGRHTIATTEENIAHVHRVILNDRRLTVESEASAVGFSRERVENILHNVLAMSKEDGCCGFRRLSKTLPRANLAPRL